MESKNKRNTANYMECYEKRIRTRKKRIKKRPT